jgi:DNA polymerase V
MAQPLYQITDLVKRHDIQVLSANFHLYSDLSNRVMQVLADTAPAMQQYSIDECFLDFSGITEDLTDFGRMVRAKVWQWTGIPVGIGIAETKTLAKIDNRIAKKSSGLAASSTLLNHLGEPKLWKRPRSEMCGGSASSLPRS